jgi:ABC-type amino acid transport substrate-binding protein
VEYPGAKRKREQPFITLGALAGSRAYLGAALGVATKSPPPEVRRLSDLSGLRIGAVSGTLSGTTLMMYRNGLLKARMVSLSQREDALQRLHEGAFDALLLPLTQFDAYRREHPHTDLALSTYRRALGVNFGFAALATSQDVLHAADRVIDSALASGELQRWAEYEGITWVPPASPDVSAGFNFLQLLND